MKALLFAILTLTAASAIANSPVLTATGDAAAGKAKSSLCAGCHGMDGNSPLAVNPKLAGLGEKYIADQLAAFKNGKRRNATMQGMVAALSAQDMLDLAAYYAGQTVQIGEADPNLVEWGQRIYRGGRAEDDIPSCMGCHGPNGTGNPAAGYPGLSGQHAQYTRDQLKAFRSGQRENLQMNGVAHRMSDQDIEALASYIQGLH